MNNTNDLTGSEDCQDVNKSGEGTVLTDLPDLTDSEPSSKSDSTSDDEMDSELEDNFYQEYSKEGISDMENENREVIISSC